MASQSGRGAPLDLWQRQAVLAAAALLRERFSLGGDPKVKSVHDMLLEVVEPTRRAIRMQREMATAASGAALTVESERRARGRRSGGGDRRVSNQGSPTGVERRAGERRKRAERRTRR